MCLSQQAHAAKRKNATREGQRAPNPVRTFDHRAKRRRVEPTGRVVAMSLKNFVLAFAAAGAFTAAIVVATAPEPLRISYAINKAAK